MTERLDVVVVNPFAVIGGAERWLLDVLGHTDRLSVRAIVLEAGPFADALHERGTRVEVIPTGRTGAHILATAVRLATRFRRRRPDVVLANGVKAAAAAVPAGWLVGVPTVWAKHDFARDATLARPLGRMAGRVLAVSPGVARATGRGDVVLAPPTVPVGPAPREEARAVLRDMGVPIDDGPVVGMATRLTPVKGVDTAVRALARPAARDWRLVVLGPDDPTAPGERDRLHALASRLGVAGRVDLVGWVPEAARWLGAFDVVAVLTRTEPSGFGREGFGMAALEALYAGVPVLGAEDSAEVARLARGGGRTVPADDPERVASALLRLRDEGPWPGAPLTAVVADHPSAAEVAARVVDTLADAASTAARGGHRDR